MNKHTMMMSKRAMANKTAHPQANGNRSRTDSSGVEERKIAANNCGQDHFKEYLENMLEPTIPFVSPGPSKWLYPINLRAVIRVPASNFSHGSIKLTTLLTDMLEVSQDVQTIFNWGSETETSTTYPSSIPFFLSRPLVSNTGQISESLSFPGPYYSFPATPGGSYYPGSWTFAAGAYRVVGSVQVVGTMGFTIHKFDANLGTLVPLFSITWSQPQPGQFAQQFNIPTGFNVEGLAMSFQRTGSAALTAVTASLEASSGLSRAQGSFTRVSDFSALFSANSSAVEMIKSAERYKISGMSIRLQNSTAELTRGGSLSMAQLGPGTAKKLPQRPDDLYELVGTLPAVMALTAMPLAKGGHISYIPQDFESVLMHPYPGVEGSCLIFSWQNTPSPSGGYYQQDLTIEIKMNVELSTFDPSLRYKLRSPLAYDYVSWFWAHDSLASGSMGCNPDHVDRIRKTVRDFLRHPMTKTLGAALMKAAPAALALI